MSFWGYCLKLFMKNAIQKSLRIILFNINDKNKSSLINLHGHRHEMRLERLVVFEKNNKISNLPYEIEKSIKHINLTKGLCEMN